MLEAENVREISLNSPQLIGLMGSVFDKNALFRFKAKGASMAPFIKNDDILTIGKSQNGYLTGEIVAFVRPCLNTLVVHRIVAIRGNKYLIKGDNSNEIDGHIPLENILGKVVRVERNGRDAFAGTGSERKFVAYLSRNKVFFVLFFFPRVLLRALRKNKDE